MTGPELIGWAAAALGWVVVVVLLVLAFGVTPAREDRRLEEVVEAHRGGAPRMTCGCTCLLEDDALGSGHARWCACWTPPGWCCIAGATAHPDPCPWHGGRP